MTWLEATVLENRHWTEALFSLRVEAPHLAFEAGPVLPGFRDTGCGWRRSRPCTPLSPRGRGTDFEREREIRVRGRGVGGRSTRSLAARRWPNTARPSGFLIRVITSSTPVITSYQLPRSTPCSIRKKAMPDAAESAPHSPGF